MLKMFVLFYEWAYSKYEGGDRRQESRMNHWQQAGQVTLPGADKK